MFINEPSIVSYVVAGGSVFPFKFKFYADTDIIVFRTPVGDVADNDNDRLAVTDYTISSNASKVGGDITITIALTDGDIITIQRSLPITRTIEYTKRGSFPASTVNDDNDYQTYLILDQFALTETYLKVPVGNVGSGVDFTFPSPEASKYIGWNPSGNGLENKTVGENDITINIVNVDTVANLVTVDTSLYNTVNAKGRNTVHDRGGGIFNHDANESAINNGVTIFDGWVRDFNGGVFVRWAGAVLDGTTDETSLLTLAIAVSKRVIIDGGELLIGTNYTVPLGTILEFKNGGKLKVGEGITLTYNGGIQADPFAQVFSGDLVQSAFDDNTSNPPYVFGVQGSPKILYTTPYMFGAIGDGSADEQEEIYSAVYFGKGTYIPEAIFRSTIRIQLRLDGQRLFGDGYNSKIISTTENLGELIGLWGEPPTTASGDPVRFIKGCTVENIHLDTADSANVNGIGLIFAQDNTIQNCFFSDIGRKAITLQYHCKGNNLKTNTIYKASQEVGSTHYAIGMEGQSAGLDFSVHGGVASTDDLLGIDMHSNVWDGNIIYGTGHNGIVITRGTKNSILNTTLPDVTGTATQIVLDDYATKNTIRGIKAGNTERRFIFTDTNATDNLIEDAEFGDNTSALSDGYSMHITDASNTLRDIRYSHSNSVVSRSTLVSAPDVTLDDITVRSDNSGTCIVGDASSTGLKVLNSKFKTPNSRSILTLGDDSIVDNNNCDATLNALGISVGGDNTTVTDNRILGNASQRIAVATGTLNQVVTGNRLSGALATINFSGDSLYSSVCSDNTGDNGVNDNALFANSQVWVDVTGALRIKTGSIRTSDVDGTVVGTQI